MVPLSGFFCRVQNIGLQNGLQERQQFGGLYPPKVLLQPGVLYRGAPRLLHHRARHGHSPMRNRIPGKS